MPLANINAKLLLDPANSTDAHVDRCNRAQRICMRGNDVRRVGELEPPAGAMFAIFPFLIVRRMFGISEPSCVLTIVTPSRISGAASAASADAPNMPVEAQSKPPRCRRPPQARCGGPRAGIQTGIRLVLLVESSFG